jgi:hypothetical protein
LKRYEQVRDNNKKRREENPSALGRGLIAKRKIRKE